MYLLYTFCVFGLCTSNSINVLLIPNKIKPMIIAKDLWTDRKNGGCTWLCRISINYVKPFVYLLKPLCRNIFVHNPIQFPIALSGCILYLQFSLQDNHNIVSRSTTGEQKPQRKQSNKEKAAIKLKIRTNAGLEIETVCIQPAGRLIELLLPKAGFSQYQC